MERGISRAGGPWRSHDPESIGDTAPPPSLSPPSFFYWAGLWRYRGSYHHRLRGKRRRRKGKNGLELILPFRTRFDGAFFTYFDPRRCSKNQEWNCTHCSTVIIGSGGLVHPARIVVSKCLNFGRFFWGGGGGRKKQVNFYPAIYP